MLQPLLERGSERINVRASLVRGKGNQMQKMRQRAGHLLTRHSIRWGSEPLGVARTERSFYPFVAAFLTVVGLMILTPSTGSTADSPSIVVDSTADDADANPGNGACATIQGTCTLRAAIQEANLHPGADTIAFNIPGTGVKTITLGAALPTVGDTTGPTTIDGYTQPGSSPNTDPLASNAKIMVQITSPGSYSDNVYGLRLTSAGNVVRGLALFKLNSAVVLYGRGAHHNTIAGNFVGTDAAGNFAYPTIRTYGDGVMMENGANNNSVGGTSPADRNVVSGNARRGVVMKGAGTSYNRVINNIVGLGPAGNKRLANIRHGIDVNTGSTNNRIGGTQPGERNVVSGNTDDGIEVSHGTDRYTITDNQVVGNFVGTDLTGENNPAYARNDKWGVLVEDRVRRTVVANNVVANNGLGPDYGGVRVGEDSAGTVVRDNHIGISLNGKSMPNDSHGVQIDGIGPTSSDNRVANNVIANNRLTGIRVIGANSDRNTITRNSIFDNGTLGVDLAPLGQPNPNDASDADSGPNEQLNFPVLQAATSQQATGTACANCTVEVFLADGGAGAYGEGKTFVGSSVAGADGRFVVMLSGVAAGNYLTATATDPAGNTSEFSLNRAAS